MKHTFHRIRTVMLILPCLVVILSACEKREILIGFSGELTGINADLSVQGRNGAILAIEEINRAGGVQSRKIKLIIRDDQGSPDKAIEADRQLIQSGVTAIIGHMTSAQSMAAVPFMEENKTVLISPTTSTPRLSGKKDHFFRLQGDLRFSAKTLGRFAAGLPGFRNVLVIKDLDNPDYAVPFQTFFLKGFMTDQPRTTGELNFSSLAPVNWHQKIKDMDMGRYHGVFIIASPISSAAIIQALRKKNRDLIIVLSSWSASQYLIQHGGRAVEGVYLSRTGVVNTHHDHYQQFYDRYEQRFGRAPTYAANHGYHAAQLLAMGLEKTGGEKYGLAQALSNLRHYQYFYGNRGFNEYGDAHAKTFILRIERGRFVTISEHFSLPPEQNDSPPEG